MHTLTIGKNDAGQRLDKFLSKNFKTMPPALMYKYIRLKKIKVNRKRAEQKQVLLEGDTVELFIKEEFFETVTADNAYQKLTPKLDIVYEDENIILMNKRPGVLVHEDDEGRDNTLLMHLQSYLYRKGEYDPRSEQSFAPALCNRIDRNTGGIVIAAKNAAALRDMNYRIKSGQVSKFYLCAVHGTMPKKVDVLKGYLKKNEKTNTVEVSDTQKPGWREIITGYRVQATKNGDSLLEVELFTGRTHQIRAHLSHIGHPLLGDGKYGVNRDDKKKGYHYQALYSYKLRFDFEKSGEILDYLSGKEYKLSRDSVLFCAEFEYRK